MTAAAPGRARPAARRPTFARHAAVPEAARTALADAQLRSEPRPRRRRRSAPSAPRVVEERADWEALRLAGAAIKDEVIRDLPALLERLEAHVTAAGGTVHWARDAAEANAIVASIVRDARRRRGGQGQVDGHPGDRAQRGARAGRASRPGRPTSPR